MNDEKFSLLQVEQQAQRRDVADRFREHCLAVIARMQPDRLRAARLTLKPASASVRDQGEAVLLADADGNEVDVDAEVLRSSVDAGFGTAMDGRDRAERVAVGARLREIREERGLSQEQVQALSGIAQETLSRIENGHRDPRMDTLRKLAAGLLAGESAMWLREEREAAGDGLLEGASGAPADAPRAARAGSRPRGS